MSSITSSMASWWNFYLHIWCHWWCHWWHHWWRHLVALSTAQNHYYFKKCPIAFHWSKDWINIFARGSWKSAEGKWAVHSTSPGRPSIRRRGQFFFIFARGNCANRRKRSEMSPEEDRTILEIFNHRFSYNSHFFRTNYQFYQDH